MPARLFHSLGVALLAAAIAAAVVVRPAAADSPAKPADFADASSKPAVGDGAAGAAADASPKPAAGEGVAIAVAAAQLPLLTHALRGRGVAEGDLAELFAAARGPAGLDPPELLRLLQVLAAAPAGADTRGVGAWLAGELAAGRRGRDLRQALLTRLRGGSP